MGKLLAGRTVVVTGGAQGIGRAFAHRFADEHANVVVADVNLEGAQRVASEIPSSNVLAAEVDVSDEASIAELRTAVEERFDSLDGLVNNAAIFSTIQMKPLWEITVDEWDRLVDVNLRGVWLATKAFLPLLRKSTSASIVNIGSDSVWEGRGGYVHYTASKAGVQGMTFSMSRELGEFSIRVNTISPGATLTEIPRATVTPEQLAAMIESRALRRAATPDDLTSLAVFLLSEQSGFITGQTFSVNGGKLHR